MSWDEKAFVRVDSDFWQDWLRRQGRSTQPNLLLELDSREGTRRVAEALAPLLRPGDVLALLGDLGAGKTYLTAALGQALGLAEAVASPTFTLVMEHRETADGQLARLPLIHMDLYRLAGEEDYWEAGLADYEDEPALLVLEWAARIRDRLPAKTILLALDYALELGAEGRRLSLYWPEDERLEALADLADLA